MPKYGRLSFTKQKNNHIKSVLYYHDLNGKRCNISKISKKEKAKDVKAELEA